MSQNFKNSVSYHHVSGVANVLTNVLVNYVLLMYLVMLAPLMEFEAL